VSNEPLNPVAMFNQAIRHKDPDEAWKWAHRFPKPVSLHHALLLTVVLGIKDDPRYPLAADRFQGRYEAERKSGPKDVAWLERQLELLGREGPPPLKFGAGEELLKLAKQLGE
jgi:hypothetical protein